MKLNKLRKVVLGSAVTLATIAGSLSGIQVASAVTTTWVPVDGATTTFDDGTVATTVLDGNATNTKIHLASPYNAANMNFELRGGSSRVTGLATGDPGTITVTFSNPDPSWQGVTTMRMYLGWGNVGDEFLVGTDLAPIGENPYAGLDLSDTAISTAAGYAGNSVPTLSAASPGYVGSGMVSGRNYGGVYTLTFATPIRSITVKTPEVRSSPGLNGVGFALPKYIYDVNFDSQGGSTPTKGGFAKDEDVVLPADPTKAGYTFAGWFDASTGGTLIGDAGDTYTPGVEADVSLFAQWTPVTYAVTYDTQGGSAVTDGTYTTGSVLTLPAAPTKAGFAFRGWFSAATGGTALGASTTPPVTGLPLELFAQWGISREITFDFGGATGGNSPTTVNYIEGDSALALPSPTKSGYDFAGFVCGPVGGSTTTLAPGASYTPSANETCTATWTKKVVVVAKNKTVSFSGNGGVGLKYTFKANKSVRLPANKFTRSGFVFAGWNTKADGSGTSYKNQATFPFTANATLYAQWTVAKASKRIAIFKGDDAALSNDMKYTIRTWISKLPAGASVTCEGSTSGLKVTAFDKALAASRAKNVCEYAKTIRKGLKYTITTNPSSANDIQARHVWIYQK